MPDGAPGLPPGVTSASSPKENHPEHPRQTPWTVTSPGTIHSAPLTGSQHGSHSTNVRSPVFGLTVFMAGATRPQPSHLTAAPSWRPGPRR